MSLKLYLVKLMKYGKKKSTATLVKSVTASASLLPMPAMFTGFASTVKTCLEEMIGLAQGLENP